MAIAQVFFDQDLRYGIDGLKVILQQKRIALKALKDSAYVLFVNRSRNQCKMISFTSRGTWLTTFRTNKGRMALDDLKRLPTLYKETGFINGKMETQLKEYLGRGVQVYTEGANLMVV
jgi:hypothetical protein